MFLSMIGRIGVVVAFSAAMAWATAVPSSGMLQFRAPRYAHNSAESGTREISRSAQALQDREVERLLAPLVAPNDADETDPAKTTALPKVRIRDPFYDFESALVAEVEARAEVDEVASAQQNARPAAAMKRFTPKPVGSGKTTVSAAWRKLANIKRSFLFAQRHSRAFRSNRWTSTFEQQ
jgi:hypothetical protein